MSDTVNIVATCRNSHAEKINSMWQALRDKSGIKFHEYHIDFTKQELRYQMPKKLTAAWGIGGQLMESQVETMFEAYELVLTHPLFVGIFARLLTDGDSYEHFGKLSDTNLAVGTYTLRHVDFLNKVINMGIEIELKNRPQGITPERLQEIFCAISYANSRSGGNSNIDALTDILWLDLGISLEDAEIDALKNGVSLLYSTDGSSVEWVHKTLYEIATARFFFNESDYQYNLTGYDFAECFKLALILFHMDHHSKKVDDSILDLVTSFKEGSQDERAFGMRLLELHSDWDSTRFGSVHEEEGTVKLIPISENDVSEEFVSMYEFMANKSFPLPAHHFRYCLMDALQCDVIRLSLTEELLRTADELGLLPEVVRFLILSETSTQGEIISNVYFEVPRLFKNYIANDTEKYSIAFSKCSPDELIGLYFEEIKWTRFIVQSSRVFLPNLLLSVTPKLAQSIIEEAMKRPEMFSEEDGLELPRPLEELSDQKEILEILLSGRNGSRLALRILSKAKKDGELR